MLTLFFKKTAIACLHQLANLQKVATGRPLTVPSLNNMTLDKDDVDIARAWLKNRNNWYDKEIITRFETEFAQWNGSKYAFAFMSGREALSACIYALGLEPDDEVIVPGYTCVVVPNAFHYAKVKVVFSDIELQTYGLDVSQIEGKISSRTRAILLQHLYGLVARDYLSIIDLARHYGLQVIEDCAHATGAEYADLKVGNRGDVAFYSSEKSKVFNTIGGGIAVTENDNIAEKLKEYYELVPYPDEEWLDRQLHDVILKYYTFKHPQRWLLGDIVNIRYGHKSLISTTYEEEQGVRPTYYGRKMAAPIAALGINQINKIDFYNNLRRNTAKRWDNWCDKNGYSKPLIINDSLPVFVRYPVLVEPEKKQNLSWALQELGVKPGIWFECNIHPVDRKVVGCPNADKAVKQCINFPTII